MGGFLVINPRSGKGRPDASELRSEAERLGIAAHVLSPSTRRRRRARRLKALGLLLRRPRGLGVSIDGRRVHARVVVVSNNRYELDLFSVGERERLDEGSLHCYVAHGWLPRTWEEQSGEKFVVDARAAGSVPRSTASPRSSGRRFASRSRRGRYACFSQRADRTSRVCGNASSASSTSSGANQRNSATSSAGSGVPSTIRAVQ